MGKHNGKARKSGGMAVGTALVNKARRAGRTGGRAGELFADAGAAAPDAAANMQSVLENSDLQEMMSMAELAGRDFAAGREQVLVVSAGGAPAPADAAAAAAARAAAEARHAHRLVVPRRPAWAPSDTPAQLDARERAAFLDWRRGLAALEGDPDVVLTPFEKNLEVWRQLWRVVERSHAVCQVLDARDPLTYRSADLEAYCREVSPAKRPLLLLNKADLLPAALRSAWADYFDAVGAEYAFWSAKAAADAAAAAAAAAAAGGGGAPAPPAPAPAAAAAPGEDARARVLTAPELLAWLAERAAAAAAAADARGEPRGAGGRAVAGLTGYPNVGKSSTINALFGAKKAAVAPTPGRTKHFQTLHVGGDLCLCDCPGLVMPQFARAKAEMVAAGVIPIDRLTDVRSPVAAVAARVGRAQLEAVYGVRLPPPGGGAPGGAPSAAELLRALALSRGWVAASGLPDETRAGRRVLKDYVDGRLLHCVAPPGAGAAVLALAEALRAGGRAGAAAAEAAASAPPAAGAAAAAAGAPDGEAAGGAPAALPPHDARDLDAADLELMAAMGLGDGGGRADRPVRAAHKFHRAAAAAAGGKARRKARGAAAAPPGEAYDGAPLPMGRRGGLVRVAGHAAA